MTILQRFLPILQWAPSYKRSQLSGDVFSGLTVGIMLIPQGMAYAMIAGLPPVYGLYASLLPQVVYAIFGTSRQLSVAPVAMDSLLVAAGVSALAAEGTEEYIAYAILLAFLMGLIQLLLGLARMGFLTNLLSKPVISGFTSAAALIIGLNQLKYLIGVEIEKSNRVLDILIDAVGKLDQTHWLTLAIGVAGIVLIMGVKKINKQIPGALLAVAVGILVTWGLGLDEQGLAIVGHIPDGIPSFALPELGVGKIQEMLPLAATISIVAFMEAFSVSKAIEAKKQDHKVDPNQELVALGAANVVGSFFRSYPVTGGFSRSAVNYQAGANTPFASVISAALIALTLLFLTPLFYFLPKAILASVIMVAVTGLIDLPYALHLLKKSKLEFALLLATFAVTLHFSMVPGIVTGIVLSLVLFIYRLAVPHIAQLARVSSHSEFRNVERFEDLQPHNQALILRVDGPIVFLNARMVWEEIEERLQTTKGAVNGLILDVGSVTFMDQTAMGSFKDFIARLHDEGYCLLLANAKGPLRDQFFKNGIHEMVGEEHVFLSTSDATEYIENQKGQIGNFKAYALQHKI